MKSTAILPLFVGDLEVHGYSHYFNSRCNPKCPNIKVSAVENKLKKYVADVRSELKLRDFDVGSLVSNTVKEVRGGGIDFTSFAFCTVVRRVAGNARPELSFACVSTGYGEASGISRILLARPERWSSEGRCRLYSSVRHPGGDG